MNGRGIFRVLALLLFLAVAVSIGTMVYNTGVSAGMEEAARVAASSGDPVVVPLGYGYGHDGPYARGPFGFGFFGLIFGILGIFLLFGLLRAAFGGRHWGGRGGPGGPGGWGGRREMAEEWHREMHQRTDAGGQPAPGT